MIICVCIIIIKLTIKGIGWFVMHYLETVAEFLHLFSSSLAEVTAPSSGTLPMAAAALEAQIPEHSLLIFLSCTTWAEENPYRAPSPHPLQSRTGAIPKIWAKSSKCGAPLVSGGSGSAAGTSQLLGKRKIIQDLQEMMAKPSLPLMGADFICSSTLPAQQGTAQAELHSSHWDYLPLVVFFL